MTQPLQVQDEEAPILLLGNKKDQERDRAIGHNLGEAYARRYNLLYWEVSAWMGENIEEAFTDFGRVLLRKNSDERVR